MARLDITLQLIDLRRDIGSQYMPGSDFELLAEAVRDIAADSLRLADGTNYVENRGQLRVTMSIDSGPIDLTSSNPLGGEPDDPTGTATFVISAGLADDLLYDFDNPDGPVSAYTVNVMQRLQGLFGEGAPFDPAEFFDAIGVTNPLTQAKIIRKAVVGVAAPAPEIGP